MKKEQFDSYLEQMKRGHNPPTLGFQITFEQFCQFAEACIIFLYKYGWTNYKGYMDSWSIKVDDKEKLRKGG